MKKKLITLALCGCTALALTGCKSDDTKTEKTEGKIILGEYKGLEVSEAAATVTDDELQTYIDSLLASYQTTNNVEEGTTKEGDKVQVIYTCTIDGEECSDLSSSSSGTAITLSEDGFVLDGFVDELIDQNIGDTVEFDLAIPEDFESTDYAGKTVHYSVEILYVIETITPELTDEWVEETFYFLSLSTVDEFTEYFKNGYRTQAILSEIWTPFVDAQTAESYDSDELAELTALNKESFESQIYYYYGIEIDAYLQAMSLSEEDYTSEMEEQAKEYLKEKMIVEKIAELENITLEDGLYEAKMLEYAVTMGLESQEELESYYDGIMDEDDFRYSMLAEKVQDFLVENVTIVPDENEENVNEAVE